MSLKNEYIFEGSFGLERETLRVTEDGRMANTPHPFPDNKYLDRDFCENQLELITPVCDSIDELVGVVRSLDDEAVKSLNERGEYLWIYSNPPRIATENDIPIARFSAEKAFKHDYRINLERRYGKRFMLYSGIHFNFSFSQRLIKSLCQNGDCEKFKTELYFRLSKQVCRYSWLLVMLTAASPVYDGSFVEDYSESDGFDGYSSRRSGDKGYWNQFIPVLDYTDLHSYIGSIREYIKKGALFSAGELYMPVRLKPPGANSLEALEENGVDHIELRMFDVNPLSKIGIFREDMEFAHYFLVYLLSLPDFEFTEQLQKAAVKNHRAAARYDLDKIRINGYNGAEAALGILEDMEIYFADIPRVIENLRIQKSKISENKRYCVEVYNRFHDNYNEKMLQAVKGRVRHNV